MKRTRATRAYKPDRKPTPAPAAQKKTRSAPSQFMADSRFPPGQNIGPQVRPSAPYQPNAFELSKANGSVYRFFSEKRFAEALLRGDVWISTLEKCRAAEEADRGDTDEGTSISRVTQVTGNGDDPEFVALALKQGLTLGPNARDITIQVNPETAFVRDAFVICATDDFSGAPPLADAPYGVEITDPDKFFDAVTRVLAKEIKISDCGMGHVIYKSREHAHDEFIGPILFIKPPDGYATQREYRFAWSPEIFPIHPMELHCPGVSDICRPLDWPSAVNLP